MMHSKSIFTIKLALLSVLLAHADAGHSTPRPRDVFYLNCGGAPHWNYVSDMSWYRPSWVKLYGNTRTYEEKQHKIQNYGVNQQYLFGSERYAVKPNSFSYKITGLKSGEWGCTLAFAETYWSRPGQRVFYAEVNGNKKKVDILQTTAKYNPHYVYFYNINVYKSGEMHIKFYRGNNDPTISAIQCFYYY